MQPSDLQKNDAIVSSPKRKRGVGDEDTNMMDVSRSALRLRTDLPSRPLAGIVHDSSPRTKMSNQMRTLNLYHPGQQVSELSFRSRTTRPDSQSTPQPALTFLEPPEPENNVGPVRPPAVTFGPASPPLEVPETPATSFNSEATAQSVAPAPEPPSTPNLKPTTSPQSAPRTISPLPTTSPSTLPSTAPLSSPMPVTCGSPPSVPRRSPPADLSPSELVWTDEEITGHEASDPQDDGYGINGIGFRPTPAMAQARHMRRKQQVAEWRSREAKEARMRRAERRRGMGVRMSSRLGAEGRDAGRRVRFVEG